MWVQVQSSSIKPNWQANWLNLQCNYFAIVERYLRSEKTANKNWLLFSLSVRIGEKQANFWGCKGILPEFPQTCLKNLCAPNIPKTDRQKKTQHFENRSTIYSYFDFGLKNSSFQLPYQRPSSSDCARELFKGSNGSASLVDCTQNKFFGWGVGFFVTDVISEVVLGSFWLMLPGLGSNR